MAGEKAGKFRFPGSALSLDGMGAGGTKIAAMPRGFSEFDSAAQARAAGRKGEWAFFAGFAACLSSSSVRLRGCERADDGAGADEFGGGGVGVEGIQFVQADILEWTPPAREFDLVASHFFLDCFPPEQLERLVGRLAGAAKPEARWLLSDFCEPPVGLGKWRARLVLEAMYLFFGWTHRPACGPTHLAGPIASATWF
jgi:hypothetical protein